MTIRSVFLLWHIMDPDDDDLTKLLGVYSSRHLASDRIERCRSLPGFVEYPDGFLIDEYQLDQDAWTEGFVEIDPSQSMSDESRLVGESQSAGPGHRWAKLLTPPHNYAVVQMPDRRAPGVVLQGDSLSAVCQRLADAIGGDLDELVAVKSELDHVLRSYLVTLQAESLEAPFSYRPPD